MAVTKGIDISHYQGIPNFDLVKQSQEFIIIKATEGVGYVDPQLNRNRSEIRRVGLGLGFYHFARPERGNSPEAEVDHFLRNVGEIKPGEVLALDFEVTFADRVNWCNKWLDVVAARAGFRPLFYTNKARVDGANWRPLIDGNYGLWMAHYDGQPLTVAKVQWPTVAIKQYSSTGRVNGINGNVDMNTFFGTIGNFKKYGKPGNTPQPEPTPPSGVNPDTVFDFGNNVGSMKLGEAGNRIRQLQDKLARTKQLSSEIVSLAS